VITQFFVKSGRYMDSVSLMKVARDIRNAVAAVEDVALMMATDANKKLLEQVAPLSAEAHAAKATDLIVMITGEESACELALHQAEKLLDTPVSAQNNTSTRQAQTLKSALRMMPNVNLAVISLGATYAIAEAWQALHNKLHVFLFSDNVSIEAEKALKQYAVQNNLLLMGPGAGTAIINQVGLGFSNAVLKGNVGIVSASGTGLQEVTTLLAKEGIGISQAIGVGSRDLSEVIGGLMAFQAIAALKSDPHTELIMVISKMPAPSIAAQVMQALAETNKPCVVIFMSLEQPSATSTVYVANTLQEAALAAASIIKGQHREDVQATLFDQQQVLQQQANASKANLKPQQKYVRGLFSGGTLCEEAMRVWMPCLGGVWSNVPFNPQRQLENPHVSCEHSAIDLGDEEFTVGRPHPMIDNELRIKRLLAEAQDATVAVVQLDIVLGYGAYENPAQELAPAIQEAKQMAQMRGQELTVIACLVGTDDDSQNLTQQQLMLESAGVIICGSNAEASLLSAYIVGENS
jgi:FdrA protein